MIIDIGKLAYFSISGNDCQNQNQFPILESNSLISVYHIDIPISVIRLVGIATNGDIRVKSTTTGSILFYSILF